MTLTIANKIRLGFAICLLFFIVASYVSYQGMVNAASNFRHYGELAGETTLAGEIQANFLKVRLSADKYLATLGKFPPHYLPAACAKNHQDGSRRYCTH